MNEQLLEPLKFYEGTGKQLHKDNSTLFFEDLLKKSGVNEEENRATVKKYNAEKAKADEVKKKLSGYKAAKVFLIILAVLGGISVLISVFSLYSGEALTGIILLACGIAALVICPIVIKLNLNPKIKNTSEILEGHEKKAAELLSEAKAQTAPLNALFTEHDTLTLLEKTLPDLDFDQNFTPANEGFFIKKHDFCDLSTDETSTLCTLSGRFAGNPFVYCNRKVHKMGTYTYHGSLTISWTETYRDSNGNVRTRRRTQTLHASLTKPKPYYNTNTYLCYGSQAAPDLSFSREPQDTEELTEKQIEKKVKKGAKQLKKKSEKALADGKNFQEMANTEFEVLFGALDRDHEVQFRLLFTPLAQRNIVDLVSDKDAYGDDFWFKKRRRCNIIQSEHSLKWDLDRSPSNYYSHDVDEIRKRFITFNEEYFKKMFFDFAPLLSIPAYVEEPCASLEDIEDYDCSFTRYEHEVMANAIGQRAFAHESAATESILKTSRAHGKDGVDKLTVTAYSYATENRLDFVPVLGGDGKMHPVPVHWVEYIPVEKTTGMTVSHVENNNESTGTRYHGMVARILD